MIEPYKVRRLLVRSERARKRLPRPYFSQIGLAFGQRHTRILDALTKKNHATQKELTDTCHIDVATMSRSLDRLGEPDYLVRERDPGCRRSFLICFIGEGIMEAEKVHRVLDFVDRQVWKGLTPEEMGRFCICLERVCDNLEHCDFTPLWGSLIQALKNVRGLSNALLLRRSKACPVLPAGP